MRVGAVGLGVELWFFDSSVTAVAREIARATHVVEWDGLVYRQYNRVKGVKRQLLRRFSVLPGCVDKRKE